MATYVLVHGGFHGGWCWSHVAYVLRRAGHEVYTPTLTGLGERSHLLSPDVGLQTHIDDIANVLRWEELSDVILCGHSYGGMVITGVAAAEKGRIAKLVYIDAFVPDAGQCMLDLVEPARRAAVMAEAENSGGGWRMPIPDAASYDIIDPVEAGRVQGLLTPHPLACCTEQLSRAPTDPTFERMFILASRFSRTLRFRSLHDALATHPGWTVGALPCGHDIMIDMPEELAALLSGQAVYDGTTQ